MAFSTINKSSLFQNNVLYTGTGSSLAITGVGFQPDLVWIKSRSATTDQWITNVINGSTKGCQTNSNAAETTYTAGVTSFDADGFTCGAQPSGGDTNANTATYVSWNWKFGGAGSANTDGSINSTVSVNTTTKMSIVKYTGTGSNATIGHGLGVAPSAIITKNLSATQSWANGSTSVGWTHILHFNETGKSEDDATIWNDTAPTSSVFSVGTNTKTNGSGNDMIAYCFAEANGFFHSGTYIGNGQSGDNHFAYCGFKPSVVIVKNVTTNSAQLWEMYDNKRLGYNDSNYRIYPSESDAESTTTGRIDLLSNGFKVRTHASHMGTDGETYAYMAWGQPIISNSGIPATAR